MSTLPQRWIMHLDMDAFYAAVEQRDNPALRGLPVVVGAQPGGRGVVATCSYEARRFGIHSAMPINEAHRRCPDAVYLPPRMAHYLEVARKIRAVMANCTPVVEPISIDEAFLDVSGLGHLIGPPAVIGQRIKAAIRTAVGLTASVGIAPNRLVAKIASDFGKPDGLVVVPPEQVLDFLSGQPVGVLRGVGSRTLPILKRLGLSTVADLRGLSLTQLQAHLGSAGRHQPLPAGAGYRLRPGRRAHRPPVTLQGNHLRGRRRRSSSAARYPARAGGRGRRGGPTGGDRGAHRDAEDPLLRL